MRRLLKLAMVVAMVAGAGVARAQVMDPSTGIMVNATSDPFDYGTVASGQPGNYATEAAGAAVDNFNAIMAQQAQSAQDFQNSMINSSNSNDDSSSNPPEPSVPKTAKPTMSPNGGKVAAGTLVTLRDADSDAFMFYTTDGSKPTTSSAKYGAWIAVSSKEKVRALAFDTNDQPSGVVTKTFKLTR